MAIVQSSGVYEDSGEEVKKQLEALDAGTFPRGDSSVPASESCQDWRVPLCPMGCVPADRRRRHLLFGAVPDCPENCVLANSVDDLLAAFRNESMRG